MDKLIIIEKSVNRDRCLNNSINKELIAIFPYLLFIFISYKKIAIKKSGVKINGCFVSRFESRC